MTDGLIAEFGTGRVIDTPLSEAGFVGLGVGAAIAGQRPVVEILFIDFLLQAMDQVVNQAAKYRFMSGGEGRVPLVIRTQGGAGNSLAGQHSQSLEALYYHIPGLKVVMPSTPRDAKALLKAAIRDEDPVIFIEHKLLYMTEGEVPDEPYEIPLGKAEIKRAGTDVTLVTWSHMTLKSLEAAEKLAEEGIDVEVVDLRTLVPMDTNCVLESVRRTGRLVVAQEAVKRGGVGSDVAAIVAEHAFDEPQGADHPGGRDQYGHPVQPGPREVGRAAGRRHRRRGADGDGPPGRRPEQRSGGRELGVPGRRLGPWAAARPQCIPRPPATISSSPVMKAASSDARKTADAAMSPGVPQRFRAVSSRIRCWTSGSIASTMSVRIQPGQMALIRICGPKSQGHRLGQPVHAGLRDDVLGPLHGRRVVEARVRGHVDDRPGALLDHHRGDGLRAQVGALEVNVDRDVPVVLGGFEDGLRDHHPGVVDQDVDPPETGEGRGDELVDGRLLRHVGLDRDGGAARGGDPGDDRIGRLRAGDVVDHDAGALGREPLGDRPADAPRGAGNDRDPAVQVPGCHPLTSSARLAGHRSTLTPVRAESYNPFVLRARTYPAQPTSWRVA